MGVQLRNTLATSRVLTLLAATGISIGAVECALRVFSIAPPELSARAIAQGQMEPEQLDLRQLQSRMANMVENSFQDVRVEPELFDGDTTRVLFLGDSFTQGAGLEDLRDRFSNLLELRINGEGGGITLPKRVDIFNAGVGGSNPVFWVHYLMRIVPVYKPDLVIAIFFLRDGTDVPISLALNREEIEPIRAKYRGMPGYEWSATMRLLYDKLAWREYSEKFTQRLRTSYVGTLEETATWKKRSYALSTLAKVCRSRRIPFHLVIFPILLDLDSYEFFTVEQEIARVAQAIEIPVFSLTPGFLGKDDRSLWVSPTDQHPNAEGHRIAAETLYPYLLDAIAGVRGHGQVAPLSRTDQDGL